jgi:hypothetical protein
MNGRLAQGHVVLVISNAVERLRSMLPTVARAAPRCLKPDDAAYKLALWTASLGNLKNGPHARNLAAQVAKADLAY